MTILSPLPVDPHNPASILPDLEAAIAGQGCFLPLPLADATRATLLRNTQRAGEPIDPSVALVMSTSGSTGTPKGAQLTPANLVASADATHQVLGGTGQWLLAMPAHHIAGIQVTGVSVNPARSTGPALFAGGEYIGQLWLFWVAPILGAMVAGAVTRMLYEPADPVDTVVVEQRKAA